MARKLNQIVATLEDLENSQALADAQEGVEAQETATAVADEAAEIASVDADIANNDDAIADAEVADDKVAELTDIAEQSLAGEGEEVAEGEVGEQGPGLSEGEATMVEITHETILASLGMPYTRTTYTSESFSDHHNKRQATLEALDNLKETAKNIGNGILAALKAAWNTVSNFLIGLVKNRALMDKHLVNLQVKVKAINPALKPAKDKLTAGAAGLSVDGVASPDTALRLLGDGLKLTDYCSSVSEAMKSGYDATVAAIQAVPNDVKLAAGKSVNVTANADGATIAVEAGKGTNASEIAAPSVQQMSSILTAARSTLAKLRDFEKTQNRLKAAVSNILSRLQEGYHGARAFAAAKINKKDGSGVAEHTSAAAAKKDARLARSLMSKVGGSIPGAIFSAVKASADYVSAGLSNYRPEKEAAAEAA